jgi:putative transposase
VSRRPPRLFAFSYTGVHRYHVRITTWARQPHFVAADTTYAAREQLLRLAGEFGFVIPAYCFMPDHVHLLLEAQRPDACLTPFIARWKQTTGYQFRRRTGARLWQAGFFDRILREQESSTTVARYILENPVRAQLAERVGDYPFARCAWTDDVGAWDGPPRRG